MKIVSKRKEMKSANTPIITKTKLISVDKISEFAENIINTVREPLLILDKDFRIVAASRSFYNFFKVSSDETIGKLIYDLGNRQWNIPKLRELLETILPEKTTFDDYEVVHNFSTIGKRTLLLNARQIERALGKEKIILLSIEDITKRKLAEEAQLSLEYRYRRLFETAKDGILILDAETGKILDVNPFLIDLLGYTKEQFIEKEIWEIGFFKDIAANKDKFLELQRKEYVRYENLPLETTEGRKINVEFVSNVYLVNNQRVIQCNIRDITERERAEVKLRRSEEKFSSAFRSASYALTITRLFDGKILDANDSFFAMTGYTFEETIGKTTMELNLWVDENDRNYVISELMNGKRFSSKSFSFRMKSRQILIGLFSAELITIQTEKCILSSINDITELKRVEDALLKSESEFRILAESMPQMVWITRADGWNIYFNQQWLDYTGQTLEESYGHGWNKPFHPDDQQHAWGAWQNATQNSATYSIESRLRRADGEYKWFLVRGVPIMDSSGKILKWFGTCTDINGLKLVEKELIEAKERAEESDKLKSEFLAQMSHEIRTPLNIILGNADYLNESFGETMNADAHKCFEGIELASKRIIRTVDLILNISELQTSRYIPDLRKVDLHSMILSKLYQEHQLSANKKGLELIYTCKEKDTNIIADEYSLTQIFANLIDNAIKYTKKGKVEILLEKNITGNIMVEIKDTGIGMSKEFLPKMFAPFVQEEQGYTRSFDGNGLGLALVKNYCKINNAQISIETKKNIGSSFIVTFGK
ncbi:MAG: PAS domain-containing sensor histidine kinase [Ignavibacteria bacterium]|nr:PAS domain-containing sensor histidine kinase [Ignavibacteria bacterium]